MSTSTALDNGSLCVAASKVYVTFSHTHTQQTNKKKVRRKPIVRSFRRARSHSWQIKRIYQIIKVHMVNKNAVHSNVDIILLPM